MNKRKLISRYAVFLLGIVIMSEPVLSYGYTIKQPIEFELSAYGNILEVAGQNATAEADPRELVSWKVYFVDEESRQIQLSVMRSGTILEGEELVIPYANSLIVNGHRWLANEDSPYRVNVYGPGEKIIYITYSDEGSVGDVDDPEASERERFEMYLERAKKADAAIVGKEAEEILDDQIICESNAKCSYRLRSLSAQIKNTVATPVYVIAKDCAATGVILKELYSTSVEYSTNLLDTIQLDGAEYRIYVFLVNKKFGETCSHNWKLEKRTEATCLSSGSEKYVCSICSKTEVKTLPALGHVDENGDSSCDRCGKRTEEQNGGDRITATYRPSRIEYQMQFVCVSENFQNGYLYISDTGIPASEFGGYGSLDYMLSNPYQAFVGTFADCFSITGQALMPIDADGALAYAAMFRNWRKRRKKEFFQRPFHFLQKYLRSKKKWSLKKQRHRSVWTARLRIQKNQMMRSFRSMRQWTERMKQQIPTTLIIKTHRIPMVKFWIPRKLRIRMRKIRRIKVR